MNNQANSQIKSNTQVKKGDKLAVKKISLTSVEIGFHTVLLTLFFS